MVSTPGHTRCQNVTLTDLILAKMLPCLLSTDVDEPEVDIIPYNVKNFLLYVTTHAKSFAGSC